jgi:autotransporter-associated beta strand protein
LIVGNNNSDGSFPGSIGGAVSLTKVGDGTLTLSGVNSYGGGTTVSGGTLELTNAAALSSMGGLVVSDGNLAVLDSSGVGGAAPAADTATRSGTAPQVETPAEPVTPAAAASPATVPATAAASTVGMIVTVSTSTGATGSASVAPLYSTTPASANPPEALTEPVAPVAGIVSGTLRVPLIRARSVRSTLPVQNTVTATAPKVVAVGTAPVVTALPAGTRAVADAGLLAWVADAPAQLAPAATGRLSPGNFHYRAVRVPVDGDEDESTALTSSRSLSEFDAERLPA